MYSDKEAEAKDAGADYVGLDEYIQKIEQDGPTLMYITMPSVMGKVGKLGKILGPRNHAEPADDPRSKTGTKIVQS